MEKRAVEDIVKKVLAQLNGEEAPAEAAAKEADPDKIPVELSGRHVHLCDKDIRALFGGPLTYVRELSQPGQYLCKERVRLIGPKGVIDNVAVLGPARPDTQVEISLTDARALGVAAPVRQSGDTDGTPGLVLASRTGVVGIEEGTIVAARHIHMKPEHATHFDVTDGERVGVNLDSARPAILKDVIVRVHDSFDLAMHIDFDEANGCGLGKDATGTIIKEAQAG